jgi:hypothetical protein
LHHDDAPSHTALSAKSFFYLSMALQPFVGHWLLFRFLDLITQTVRHFGRGIKPSQDRYLHTGQRTQTSMPQVGFKPIIPMFERAETVHALDPAATVIG